MRRVPGGSGAPRPQGSSGLFRTNREFVQSLANIQYLNHLAQNKYLQDPAFVRYLDYLQYWRQPQYAKHLVYPDCLHVLALLQNEQFRKDILRADVAGMLMNEMVERWSGVKPETAGAAETETGGEEAGTTDPTQPASDQPTTQPAVDSTL